MRGDGAVATALTSFAPRRMIPLRSASRPTSKPLTSWMKRIGNCGLVALEHEPRGLVCTVGVDHAAELDGPSPFGPEPEPLAGDHPQRHSSEMSAAADDRLAVVGAKLIKRCAVQQAGKEVAGVILGRRLRADDAVEIAGRA